LETACHAEPLQNRQHVILTPLRERKGKEREGKKEEQKERGRVEWVEKKEGSMRNENGKRKGNGALATIWHALACL